MSSPIEWWRSNRAIYEKLAERVGNRLRALLRAQGIRCVVESRAKAMDSFVKKMIRKRYDDPLKMGDKAGARVICLFNEHRNIIIDVVGKNFETNVWDDKQKSLKPHEMGYLGVHCQLKLKPEDAEDLRGLECELQIHTSAEHAWSAPVHDLVYKPPEGVDIPVEVERAAFRLTALTEIYDNELSRIRAGVYALPTYGYAHILRGLDSHYYRLTAREYDRELSVQVIHALQPLYGSSSAEQIVGQIDDFVAQYAKQLVQLYSEYSDVQQMENVFLFQPESLMLLERVERSPAALQKLWLERFERSYLEPLFNCWGRSLD